MPSTRGFTLIELMIVVAVVAILAAIAFPAFTEQMRKSRRAEARSGMSQIQLLQERWRADNPSYGTLAQIRAPTTSENGKWTFDIPADSISPTGYTVTASLDGGHTDPTCASGFTLVVDGNDVDKDPPACWQ